MDAAWAALNARIEACQICALVRNITHKVPGQGNPKATQHGPAGPLPPQTRAEYLGWR